MKLLHQDDHKNVSAETFFIQIKIRHLKKTFPRKRFLDYTENLVRKKISAAPEMWQGERIAYAMAMAMAMAIKGMTGAAT